MLSKPTKMHFKKTPRYLKTLDSSASIFVPFVHQWSAECQEYFEELKKQLISGRVFAYPDFSRPFVVEVDASHQGLEAVLYLRDSRRESERLRRYSRRDSERDSERDSGRDSEGYSITRGDSRRDSERLGETQRYSERDSERDSK